MATQKEPNTASSTLPVQAEPVTPFGKYVLVRALAQGGMAEIFLAKQVGAEGFERNVVIKRMLKHLSANPEFVNMFLDEARLAGRLAHQNVVQIYELGQVEGSYYICMEYLAGEDFATVLSGARGRRMHLPLDVVASVIIGAAHGLHFAHEFTDEDGAPLNIVHRDISPANLFVTYQGQVKVLDFGIAKAESRVAQTTAGQVKGKFMYMPPEQARSEPIDRRADVYSLGVSLYEAATLRRPFTRDHEMAVLNAVLKGEFKRPSELREDLPPELERIILKAMANRPEERYPTAADMAADLERFLGTLGPRTPLATFLRHAFDAERISLRSRIPSLETLRRGGASLAALTVSVPISSVSSINPPAVRSATSEEPTRSDSQVRAAEAAQRQGSPRKWGLVIGIAAGLLLSLGAVAGGYLYHLSRNSPSIVREPLPPPPVAVVEQKPAPVESAPPVESPAPAAAAAESPAVAPPAPVEPEKEEAPAVVATPKAQPATGRGPRPLTESDIRRVVQSRFSALQACFETHRDELPASRGMVNVYFTILRSGKVKEPEVEGPLEKTRVGQCLRRQFARFRFRAHTENLRLGVPVDYTIHQVP